MEHYYKFMSVHNLQRFLDILINKHLYAARYTELNDPLEGWYLTDERHAHIIRSLQTNKFKTRICSLTKNYRHILLWSHYADAHRGCCIEISPAKQQEIPSEVNYVESLPDFYEEQDGKTLLSHKLKAWQYENEVRFFRKTKYITVNIHRIIFGMRVTHKDFEFYKKLIKFINSNIEVEQIKKEDFIGLL